MAEASCGPSNPLQQLKQHTGVDTSLQQDRVRRAGAGAISSFRTQNNRDTGRLEAEFEAFQAGVPASDTYWGPQFAGNGRSPQMVERERMRDLQSGIIPASSAQPSWATDFQRLRLSSPTVFEQQHVSQAGPLTSNWAQGFKQHMESASPRAQTAWSSPQAFQYQARYGGLNGFQSNFAPSSNYGPATQISNGKGKEAVIEQFDDAAFERAFDQAREDMVAIETSEVTSASDQGVDLSHAHHADLISDFTPDAMTERLSTSEVVEDLRPIPEDFIQDGENELQKQQEEDDALAATAQDLLSKVEHNESDKFKNSLFLSLMRKLRDREVRVEGDRMVETATASSTTETAQPLNAAKADVLRFDNSEQRPSPLLPAAAVTPAVDIRPAEYQTLDENRPFEQSGQIPTHEQDHDAGRTIDPLDGQEVVDLLSRPGPISDDVDSEFMMTSPFSSPPLQPAWDSIWQERQSTEG